MPRWKAGAIVIVLIVLTFGGVIDRVQDMLFYPWARATPPLLDEWVGHLTTGNGEPLTVAFALVRGTDSDGSVCSNCAQIDGRAVTCDAQGTVRRYDVFGSPTDRAGHRLHLNVKPEPDVAPDGLDRAQGGLGHMGWRRRVDARSRISVAARHIGDQLHS